MLGYHFHTLGIFVIRIIHYIRAYSSYKALTDGEDFDLRGDIGLLNVSADGV